MIQEFFIKQNSTLPVLRMELIDGGKYDFERNDIMNKALQDAVITFSMKDAETGELIISNAKASKKFSVYAGCSDKVIIEYAWNKRDTKRKGTFIGEFNISFNGNITEGGIKDKLSETDKKTLNDKIDVLKNGLNGSDKIDEIKNNIKELTKAWYDIAEELQEGEKEFPIGNLLIPIHEELRIYIN